MESSAACPPLVACLLVVTDKHPPNHSTSCTWKWKPLWTTEGLIHCFNLEWQHRVRMIFHHCNCPSYEKFTKKRSLSHVYPFASFVVGIATQTSSFVSPWRWRTFLINLVFNSIENGQSSWHPPGPFVLSRTWYWFAPVTTKEKLPVLVASFCQHIYGQHLVKAALLLAVLGGHAFQAVEQAQRAYANNWKHRKRQVISEPKN